MYQQTRERLTLILVALLPFHAFLVTVGTRILRGPNQAPWTLLALWKELLLLVILGLALTELWQRCRNEAERTRLLAVGPSDWIISALFLIAFFVTAVTHRDWVLFLYGFKYDFLPLILYAVLRRTEWSLSFTRQLEKVLVIVGGIVAGYGLLTLVLPEGFFAAIGYSVLHSLYIPEGPVAAFQQIGGTGFRRMQSTMSGPNQLGLWLLIPFSLALISLLLCHLSVGSWGQRLWRMVGLGGQKQCSAYLHMAFIGAALLFTFSRSAWIAAVVMVVVAFILHFQEDKRERMLMRFGGIAVLIICMFALVAPDIVIRLGSSRAHVERPLEAVQTILGHPFGLGLGSAGPASNRVSDPCVHLRPQDDPSWAQPHTQLCVFVGDTQVQPTDRACRCPVLPENWYLQIGVELGLVGFILYVLMIAFILKWLWMAREHTLAQVTFLSFLGVSVAGMLLHAWEDAAVAYTLWLLVAVVISRSRVKPPPFVAGEQ